VLGIRKKDKIILRNSFNRLKDEMTDHLDAINENTNEINSNQSYLAHLETMMMKLTERLDDIELKLAEITGEKKYTEDDFKNIILTRKEEEIFKVLYENTGDLLNYKKIARSLGLTQELVRKHITSIINKGIPIIKKYFDNNIYLVLDSDFRNLQAKKNIVKIK